MMRTDTQWRGECTAK